MPGYKAHCFTAAVVVGGMLYLATHLRWHAADPIQTAGMLAAGVLASLLPDVDTDSKGQHLFYGLLALADLALLYDQQYKPAAVVGFVAMLPAISRHRGFTHAPWAAVALPALVAAVPMLFLHTTWQAALPFYLAAVAGYGSHLALDKVA